MISRFLFLAAVLFLSCSSPSEMCKSLRVGQSAEGLPLTRIESIFSQGLYGMAVSNHAGTGADFDEGPVSEQLCCLAQQSQIEPYSQCTPEILECAQWPGVEVYAVGKPYAANDPEADYAYFCSIAVRDNIIIAIWGRTFS